MSDAVTTNEQVVNGVPSELDSERNNTIIKFVQGKKRKTKSDTAETIIMTPQKPTTDEDYKAILSWAGVKDAALLVYQKVRQLSVNLTDAATKDGVFNGEQFLKFVHDMSPRAETKADLLNEQADLQKQLIAALADTTLMVDVTAFRAKIDEIGMRMKEISETLAFRAASKEEEEDADTANATAAPAAA